ncbi:pyruvate dehydrogenase complex E1 component, alpha subunit [Candidatus Koribacter versatilis Ellin345]|uniref:Pyruvate dehydrogenase complex E1 component, alpha subunit n=1 Tax=Koribacter versatilis (strain Ellin345) TaxID=204669 RepID=Q1IRE1_KORVE|nr:thiamine pyrophosphate-dependent enzyme [Candidatus Koribacter versatilis]ABF40559.1 pyruvate dehydrogenase complex E1 component, alpha subunit [Candidatus Koribacter versatilis Ellin345]
MPTRKPKHQQAHEAVNTPPSRNPVLMRRMYSLLAQLRAEHRGLEATLVGSLMGLLPEDSLTIAHARSLTKTLYTKKSRPELLDLAPLERKSPELSAAAHIAVAAGYALERALHHRPGLVLAFAGEADSLMDARATLTFAATHKLPLVVVVQHNLARLKTGSPSDLTHEILGLGLAGMTVDGSDAMAVYRVAQEAMFRARHDAGPTLIECKTYSKGKVLPRMRPWVQGDALSYMEEQLRARNFWKNNLKK